MLWQISISLLEDLKPSVHTTNLHKIKFYLSILLLMIKVATYGIREVVVKKYINHAYACV